MFAIIGETADSQQRITNTPQPIRITQVPADSPDCVGGAPGCVGHGAGAGDSFVTAARSYQHKIIFYEPMITLAYLLSRPQATFPIEQPQAFAQKGYYPTSYRIEHDDKAKEYRVVLLDSILREAA